MIKGYDSYSSIFLINRHLREVDSVTPTKAMHNYSEFEHSVMCYENPIYNAIIYGNGSFRVLWNKMGYNKDGIYDYWFGYNYYGTDSYRSAWRIGNLIEE